MNKRIATSFIIFLLLLALLGCSKREEAPFAPSLFLGALRGSDFASAYEYLTPAAKEKISKEDFVKRYELMVNELGITGIYVDSLIIDYDAGIAQYNLHYALEGGELSYVFRMPILGEEESWLVDWSPALVAPQMDWGDELRVVRVPAKRGEIFSGADVLAKNAAATTVFANRTKIESEELFCAQLAPLIGEDEEYIRKRLKIGGDVVIIKSMLPDELDPAAAEEMLAVAGVGIDSRAFGTIREYPYGPLMGHTLGYVGPITGEELANFEQSAPGQYTGDSIVGKSGLELAYEAELRGRDGREYYIAGSEGQKKATLLTIPAEDGLDLHLNVNVGMQQRLEEVMALSLASHQTGAAIALNPKTGAIKALCSYPGFDPNVFVRGVSQDVWEQFNDEANHLPLFNRLTRGLYPPGSIIKPFTAACYLENGAITQHTTFEGDIEDDYWTPQREGWHYPPIKRVEIRNRPSPLNLENAMITSDNIFFAYGAMETGEEKFLAHLDAMGMNEAMPFELPLAKPHVKNENTDFHMRFLAESGYGQGEILITPVQMAAMYTALESGDIMIPRLVSKLYKTEGNEYILDRAIMPKTWKEGAIEQTSLDAIKPALEKVITDGTGYTLRLRDREIAGKTGTAQVGNREVSWFAAYTLDRQEPLLCVVVIDTEGGVVKFDIVRELLEYEG